MRRDLLQQNLAQKSLQRRYFRIRQFKILLQRCEKCHQFRSVEQKSCCLQITLSNSPHAKLSSALSARYDWQFVHHLQSGTAFLRALFHDLCV